MLVYDIKTINLRRTNLPIACTSCGHENQSLQIYQKIFSLYFFPVIPLRKKGIITCPSCFRKLKEKSFIQECVSNGLDSKQIKFHFKSIFKTAKTPFHLYVTPFLLIAAVIAFFAYCYNEDLQKKELVQNYLQNPVGNVIAVVKSSEDLAYPYVITYIADVNEDATVVFDWRYGYESAGDAEHAVRLAYASVNENKLKANFGEPYLVHTEGIKATDIVRIYPLNKAVDWKQFAPQALTP